MAKKHWINIKRGLSEDPKHREAMGMAVWAFIHILDRADWETGIVYDWRDKDEASDMGVNERTLRDWRQRLDEKGYISCCQKQRGLEILIYNWINPRDYSSGVLNPKPSFQGDTESAPLDFQGDTQGDTQVRRKNVTPTSDSKDSENPDSLTPAELSSLEIFTNAFGMFVSNKEGVRWYEFVEKHKPTRAREIVRWALKKEIHLTNRAALMDSIETAAERWTGRKQKPHKQEKSNGLTVLERYYLQLGGSLNGNA